MEAPLYLAAEGGHTDIVRLLLSHGVNPNITDRVSTKSCIFVSQEGIKACINLFETTIYNLCYNCMLLRIVIKTVVIRYPFCVKLSKVCCFYHM